MFKTTYFVFVLAVVIFTNLLNVLL